MLKLRYLSVTYFIIRLTEIYQIRSKERTEIWGGNYPLDPVNPENQFHLFLIMTQQFLLKTSDTTNILFDGLAPNVGQYFTCYSLLAYIGSLPNIGPYHTLNHGIRCMHVCLAV